MGFFSDMAGMAAKGAGISVRKSESRRAVAEMKRRADQELQQHCEMYANVIEDERKRYYAFRENSILTYMFTQIMLGQHLGERDFSFLDQLPAEYRKGTKFKQKLQEVEDEYYTFLAEGMRDNAISAASIILALKDLRYFSELRDELQAITGAECYFESEPVAGRSIFTGCDDIEKKMEEIKQHGIVDIMDFTIRFSEGLTDLENGKPKEAVRRWLFGDCKPADFDIMKMSLLQMAQDNNQDAAVVESYSSFTKVCRRLFGFTTVQNVNGKEEAVLYPSMDMVIGEVMRHMNSGTVEQYNNTLKDWLECCGDRVEYGQLNVLQQVFAYLNAFEQEAIVLEYMVQKNMARTPEQEQRLKFLKGRRGGGGTMGAKVAFSAPNVQVGENELLYDHRFVNWKTNDIQQYFDDLTLTRKSQSFMMVIDEWQKDISVQGICWDIAQVMQLVTAEIKKNFGDTYDISIISAGAAVDDWVDTLPVICIQAKDESARNAELSFLVSGEQITNAMIHLSIMVLLAPTDSNKSTLENDVLCRKVVSFKEKHNPRIDTFISTMKNILINQLELWINQSGNQSNIY